MIKENEMDKNAGKAITLQGLKSHLWNCAEILRGSAVDRTDCGKTLVVASTRGNLVTDLIIDGQPVIIGLNAYIKKQKEDG